jgi:hypothetical protein
MEVGLVGATEMGQGIEIDPDERWRWGRGSRSIQMSRRWAMSPGEADKIDLDPDRMGPGSRRRGWGSISATGGGPWLTEPRQALTKSLEAVIDLDQDGGQTKRTGELDQSTRKTSATRMGTSNGGQGDLVAAVTSKEDRWNRALIPC